MKIEIECRQGIKARAAKPFPDRTALISVTDSDRVFAALDNKPAYFLKMKFDDVTDELFDVANDVVLAKILGRTPTEAEALELAEHFYIFSDEQADEIALFVKSILGNADILICQCEYGQSRSAGIAAAVKQFLSGDGSAIFADDRYFPNKLVYRKVLNALIRSDRKRLTWKRLICR